MCVPISAPWHHHHEHRFEDNHHNRRKHHCDDDNIHHPPLSASLTLMWTLPCGCISGLSKLPQMHLR